MKKAKSVAVRLKRGVIYWGDKRKFAGQVYVVDVIRSDGFAAATTAENLRNQGFLVRTTEGTTPDGRKVWILWTRKKKAKKPGREKYGVVSRIRTYKW